MRVLLSTIGSRGDIQPLVARAKPSPAQMRQIAEATVVRIE
jgi:hypothetical protein